MFKVNNKDTRTISATYNWNILHTFFSVSFVDFEQLNVARSCKMLVNL